MGGAEAAQRTGWGDLGQAAVVDGVRLIAGGIESVLQRLQIQVHAFRLINSTPLDCKLLGSCKEGAPWPSMHFCQSKPLTALYHPVYDSALYCHIGFELWLCFLECQDRDSGTHACKPERSRLDLGNPEAHSCCTCWQACGPRLAYCADASTLVLQATKITLRVELPPVNEAMGPPSLVILHLDSLTYSGASLSNRWLAGMLCLALQIQKAWLDKPLCETVASHTSCLSQYSTCAQCCCRILASALPDEFVYRGCFAKVYA